MTNSQPTDLRGAIRIEKLSRVEVLMARSMSASAGTMPVTTLWARVDMDKAVALREQWKIKHRGSEPKPPTYNDLVVKASGLALRDLPRANSAWADGKIEVFARVNIGVAVALDTSLVVPTVFDADRLALGDLAAEIRRLTHAVTDKTVTADELSGATFTVSNLGMYGIESFDAIITPPQVGILTVGEVHRVGGAPQSPWTMTLGLTCDHRVLYGAYAAGFLARIRALLEQPEAL